MENSVRVLSTLALAGAVRALAEQYRAKSGARIDADFAPTVRLLERLKGGETADVLILTDEGLAGLVSAGTVLGESRVDLARSWVGLAVAAGQPHPDISTEAALRVTLLAARSVAYSRLGASGIFFAQLIARMGIEKEINARATISPMGFTAERIVTGEADVAARRICC
ncbi:substrate-binding domain-containing protein [Bradyrhizobium sp.]|uniref:substrate-binding domain-containing protein n=1 Tax=Bradyrhizobium sp. TaxID=376 RepID=UPI00341FF2BC